MGKFSKREIGITLIALIITIIIMLILVAVSISILINSGLIGKAKEGAQLTKTSYEQEQRLGETINVDGVEYTLDEYLNSLNVDGDSQQGELGDWIAAWVQNNEGWSSIAYLPTDKNDEELASMGTIVAKLYENGEQVTITKYEYDEINDESIEITNTLDAYTLEITGTGELSRTEFHNESDDIYYGWALDSRASQITNVIISSGITTIPDSFFRSTSLTNLTVPDSVVEVGWNATGSTHWYDNQADGLVYVGKVCVGFKGDMPNNGTLTIKDGTKAISKGAFWRNTELENVILPSSLININEDAFFDCYALESITIPSNVLVIGTCAFHGCDNLTSVTFQDTTGWFISENENASSGTNINVTNTSSNANNLKNASWDETPGYSDRWWKKTQ